MADDNREDGADPALSEEVPQARERAPRRDDERGPSRRKDHPAGGRLPAPAAPETASGAGERISKVVSRAGVASRRDVERMIEEGRIALNGQTVTTPVTLVTPRDRIAVDGVPLPEKERTRLFLYHKPTGLVTTEKDPEGRPTVFEALPADLPRLVSIGRLDFNTEGLLLLTNDGGLARVLAHPSTGWLRRYRARAFGEITQDQLDQLKGGIEIEGMHYGPVEAHVDREQGSNMWLTLGLREGKNREVKRILEHFGLQVNRLIRISFGPFRLGDLGEGAVEEVRPRLLKDQLGPELAREAKVDFGDEERHGRGERAERQERRPDQRGERRPEGTPPRRFERSERPASGRQSDPPDARVLRKAEAVAQGRRGAAHRHSWRDPESWALRGERKAGAARKPEKRLPRGLGQRGEGAEIFTDERTHLRGGRSADRKGRSILVERIAQDPAGPAKPQRKDGAAPASHAERQREPRPPRGENDVLRRKTLREQGVSARPRGDGRERGPRPERSERRDAAGSGAPSAPRAPWKTRTERDPQRAAAPYRLPRPDDTANKPGRDRTATGRPSHPRGEGRERGPRPERFERAERPRPGSGAPSTPRAPWKAGTERDPQRTGAPHRRAPGDSPPRKPGEVRPARFERDARPPQHRDQDRPPRREGTDHPHRREDQDRTSRPAGRFRPRRDRPAAGGPPRPHKPIGERPGGFKPRGPRPEGARTGGFGGGRKEGFGKGRVDKDRASTSAGGKGLGSKGLGGKGPGSKGPGGKGSGGKGRPGADRRGPPPSGRPPRKPRS